MKVSFSKHFNIVYQVIRLYHEKKDKDNHFVYNTKVQG